MFALVCWAVQGGSLIVPRGCNCGCCRTIYGSPVTLPGSAIALFWIGLVVYCGYGSFRSFFSRVTAGFRRSPAPGTIELSPDAELSRVDVSNEP